MLEVIANGVVGVQSWFRNLLGTIFLRRRDETQQDSATPVWHAAWKGPKRQSGRLRGADGRGPSTHVIHQPMDFAFSILQRLIRVDRSKT
jgi:hypothetical protein